MRWTTNFVLYKNLYKINKKNILKNNVQIEFFKSFILSDFE